MSLTLCYLNESPFTQHNTHKHMCLMSNPNFVKHCRVCGDVALGFNFNGLSCESCKAFFRRNAVKTKVFKCPKNGACTIDMSSRKYCKRCRLQKCYKIGMKKELIVSYRESNSIKVESKVEVLKNDESNKDLSDSSESSNDNENSQLTIFKHSENHLKNILQIGSIHLQTYDLERLREIYTCKEGWQDETSLQVSGSANSLLQVMNLAEQYVIKIIQFCRNFSSFTCLNQNDQMIMLKAFHPEISAIGAAFLYNPVKDGLPVLMDGSQNKAIFVKLDFSHEMKQKEIVGNFRRFLYVMKAEMENDSAIRDIICAQLLFTTRDSVTCPEFIKYNHAVYSHLLRRYLQYKYRGNGIRAEEKYGALMKMLKQISGVAQIFHAVYSNEVDITKVAQVLAEIYNLL